MNCREYLRLEFQMAAGTRVVIALGQIAFRAVLRLWKEMKGIPAGEKFQFRHGGEWILPGDVVLLASYHPSQQNTQTGKLTRPMFHEIFHRARQFLTP